MKNGQLKPAYNVQHAVNSGFIVATGVFLNPTDVMTLKPFMEQMESSLNFKFDRIVADAGYESEENLVYLRNKEIEAYILWYNVPVTELMFFQEVTMDYLTTSEVADKWGISRRRVTTLCRMGRLEGAVLKGKTWLVPENVNKPNDLRKKVDK